MGQKCMKVFAAWVIVVGAAGAAEWNEAQLVRLASGDDDEIKRAVEGLAARYDQAHYALMQGLFKGEVYRWGERQAQHGLVIVGDEEMDDYGDSIVPLFTVYPEREPLLDEGGEPVKISLYDIEEVKLL